MTLACSRRDKPRIPLLFRSFNDFKLNFGSTVLDHIKILSRPAGNIDNFLLGSVGSSIIDTDDDTFVVLQIGYFDLVPRGRVRCAAVRAFLSYFSPLVKGRPTSLSL